MDTKEKCISAEYASDIQTICKPLFENTGIKFFNYARYYKSGSGFAFSSDVAWHQFLTSDIKLVKELERVFTSVQNGTFLWSMQTDIITQNARSYFDIDFPLAMVKDYGDFYEIANFGARPGNEKVLDLYFNHVDALQKFLMYFKDKASPLINIANTESNRFAIPKFPANSVLLNKEGFIEANPHKLLSEIKIDKYFFYDDKEFKYLTRREVECLIGLLRGQTAKKTAAELNISRRTVEEYISLAKGKLKCHTRSQLVDKAFEIGLITLAQIETWR